MSKLAMLVALGLVCIVQVESKTFGLCEMVRELRRQGFPENQLRDWVCLIQAESSFRTHVVSPPNSNGSRDYGLFQINDRYWCNPGATPGKDCNIRCSDLLLDDITIASTCAKKIYQRHLFRAWYGWIDKCEGRALPVISHC